MMEMFVKPRAADIKVRRPEKQGEHIPFEGTTVPKTSYYLRRLAEGDLVVAKPVKGGK